MVDKLINCPRCGSDACFEQEIQQQNIKLYHCMGCGFISNSLMKEGETFYEEQLETLPELYKELIWEDSTKQRWMPGMTNVPDKGMVFAFGNSVNDWKWRAVLAVEIKEEEKTKYPIPGKPGEYYKWRMDMNTAKDFPEREYMDALSYVGFLPE